ncbi:MAG TPA: chitobiase/beta-hexosaminidase C-terminal domain-containing protein [Candidatus Aquilonibacter sp.]|nr:chitobiase/beta-hexosaminidase C-terminal domain-containing protein [Candidatus Aquilonibacter sp.]
MKGSLLCDAVDGNAAMERTDQLMQRRDVGAWVMMLAVLTLCLCAAIAGAQTVPNVVISQTTTLAPLGTGGALAGTNPAGSSMAVDSAGNLYVSTTYGGSIVEFSPGSTTASTLGKFSNPGGIAIDPAGNLYIGQAYSATIIKVPLVSGSFAAISTPSSSTPTCTGSDTAECALPISPPISGVVSMVFDAAGDLFFASENGGTDPNTIFECTAACLTTGTPAPAVLFSESATATTEGTSSALENLGGIAVDPWGDVFFTDSLMDVTNASNGYSYQSSAKELVYSGGAYSSTPTTLYTLTPSSPGNYDDQLDGIATDSNGTVYYATQYDGIFAFPNNKGTVTTTTPYVMSSQGAKILATDGHGNFYVVSYVSSDTAIQVGVGVLTVPASSVGSSSTSSATTILNDEGCSSSPVVNFSTLEGTTSTTEFTAATTGSCSTLNGSAASYKTTLTFTPAYGGTRTATINATEASGPGSSGSATVTGFATGQLAPPTFSPVAGTYNAVETVNIYDQSPGVSIYYTTDGSTPTTSSTLYAGPLTVSATETINAIATSSASGVTASNVSTGTFTILLPAATPTFSPAGGSYAATQTVTISDATSGATIYYTTDGSTPTTSSAAYTAPITVASSTVVKAIAAASGLPNSAVGSSTYEINTATYGAALSVLMTQNSQLGTFDSGGALPGGSPSGNSFAVDSNGNLITGNSYGGKILEFGPEATTYTVLGSYSNPGPVAIDPSGNLYIASTYGGTITKVPFSGGLYAAISTPGTGTPTCTGTDTAECVLPFSAPVNGIVAMTFDAAGDLFFTSTNGTPNPNSVLECTAACVKTGSPTPAVLYAESTTATTEGASTALWFMGGIAVDPWGDVFFTDSLMDSGGAGSGFSYQSAVRELTYSGGAYSTTPTSLYTLTPGSPGNYDDQLDAVAVDGNGTVYFGTQYDGVFAYPSNKGAVNTTTEYTVSTQGAKMLTLDSKGNAYVSTYSSTAGGDVAIEIAIDNISLPNAAVPGSSSVSNVTTILNDGACSTNPVVSFSATENGAASTEFTANTTGTCASTSTGGASFATTVNFAPTVAGTHTGILTAEDTVNGGIGTATVFGVTAGSAAATPTFSPAAGTYTSVQSVTISDTTPGATIYYTTDGSTPSPSSTKYTGAISVTQSEAINAIAVVSGLSNSAVATSTYTLNLPLTQTPVISVAAGTYTSVQTVKITDGTVGSKIYYTTDGSTPTTASTQYKTPLSVSASETLNAIAYATGYAPSTVASATYTINLTVDPPTFSPAAGTFTTIQKVTLADTTAGAAIYYTTDGSTPTANSTLYSAPIAVNSSETINAIGVLTGYANSPVARAVYTLNLPPTATPTISLGTGTYTVSQPVTISDTTTGAVIYYTTNGSTPTAASTMYTGPITLSATETLNAIAVAVGYSPSAVATAAYTVNLMPPGFALSVNPSSLTIPSTATFGTIQLTVQPQGGFTGAVALACSGLPSGASCGFSSSPVNLTNYNQPQVVTVTISTGQTAMLQRHGNPWAPEATLALVLCFFGFRKRRGIQIVLLAVISVLGVSIISGCGSSSPGASTSTVTVTATAGSLTTKTTVSVTMNH